ncbi:hypothetical protein ACFYO2_07655 [Streptomyces sp. NPDC006602]|uniref:hypothetical protein n=1 Tax=Streptomyces sp. NPDC006602 TaxID=3364751 RepID=UPI0036C9D67D
MADIALQIRIDADAETVHRAVSAPEGVAGWFTTGAEIGEGIGALHRLSFPDAPMTWDFRIDQAEPGKRRASCWDRRHDRRTTPPRPEHKKRSRPWHSMKDWPSGSVNA